MHAGRLGAVLQLDRRGDRPGMRVEHQDRLGVLLKRDVDVPGDHVVAARDDPLGDRDRLAELVAGVDVGVLDRRTGQDVVELVEQDLLPGVAEFAPGIFESELDGADRGPALRGQDRGLRAALPLLDAGVRRVAADRVHLQVVPPDRQFRQAVRAEALGELVEVAARRGQHQPAERAHAVVAADRVDVGPCRAAAVVSDAVEDHGLPEIDADRAERLVDLAGHVASRTAVLVGNAVGKHPRAVRRLPPERGAGQAALVWARPQEAVGVHALAAQDLRQHPVVSERVGVHTDRGGDAELLREVPLAVEALPNEGLAARQVAVRLDPPAADHLPAALGDPLADTGEQFGVGLLHPAEQDDLIAGEDEVGVLVHPVDGRPECRPRLLVALLPRPQPHRVEVGVADHVQGAIRCRDRTDGRLVTRMGVGQRCARPDLAAGHAAGSAPAAHSSTISLMMCSIRVCIS